MPTLRTKLYYLSDGEEGEVRYVGKTSQALARRLSQHLSHTKENNYRTHWIRSAKDLRMHLIAEVDGTGSAEEIELIASLRRLGARMVNGTVGGEGVTGRVLSEESRARMSAAQRGVSPAVAAVRAQNAARNGATNKGRPLSAETRAKMSASRMGRLVTPETRAKISARHKGRKHTAEALANMRAAYKARSRAA